MAWPILVAAAGAAVSAFGSMQASNAAQSNANDQAKAAKEQWKWNWKDTKDKERYDQFTVDVANKNNENVAVFTDAVSGAKYSRQLAILDFDYINDVNEYNEAEEQYADQIDYNALAAQLAKDEQAVWLQEQLDAVSFDKEEVRKRLAEQRDTIGFDKEDVQKDTTMKLNEIANEITDVSNKLGEYKDTYASESENINLMQGKARAETAFQLQQNRLKGLQDEGQARAMGQTGRTARKNQHSALATVGLQSAMLVDALTRADSVFDLQRQQNLQKYSYQRQGVAIQLDTLSDQDQYTRDKLEIAERRLGRAETTAEDIADLDKRRLNRTKRSAKDKDDANSLRILYDQYGADLAAHGNRLAMPPAYKDLPPVIAPYKAVGQEPIIPDAFKTKSKPPMPPGAPNLTAGVGMMAAGSAMGTIAGAAASYDPGG